jgi:hypothetical protein
VPDVVLLDAERIDSYVLMPAKVDQQRIVWERSGLQAKMLPEPLRALRGPADLPYGTIRPRFQATIKDIQLESGLAVVRLADHCLDLDAGGHLLGVSAFDLEPAGRNECRLKIPEDYRVLHLTVAGLPVPVLPDDQQRLRVPLGSQQLAQRIEVLFAGRVPSDLRGTAAQELTGPSLEDLPVEQTCWTVRSPAAAGWQVAAGSPIARPETLDWLRVHGLGGLLAKAEEVLKDGDPQEIARWYVPWARRWAAARSRLGSGAAGEEALGDEARKELAGFDENQRRIVERLGVQAYTLIAEQDARHAFEISDVWRIAADPASITTTWISRSPTDSPQIRRADAVQAAAAPRWRTLGLLAALTLIGMLLLPHPSLDDPLRRHPEILGVVLGAIWWWAFAASAVGFVLFALSLTFLLLRVAKRRRRRLALVRPA